jgi:RHS repeat-associated protein
VQVGIAFNGPTQIFAARYDAASRLRTVSYPSGFAVTYTYTSLGYAQQLTDAATGQVYWTANARDAELHLTQQTAGNGIVTSQGFDPQTGRLNWIQAGASNIVENFSYTYDVLGNVLTRADANQNLTETFTYDILNRMTSAQVSQNIAPAKTFAYDVIGNLLSKSDVGNYTYPLAGSALPHAVTNISGGTINTSFTYDSNGNQTSGLGRSVSYTSYNKPSSITQGSKTLSFYHDVDHQRFVQVSPEGTTLYFDAFGVRAEAFFSATMQWNEYLTVGGALIGMRVLHSDLSVTLRYFHADNLGSIAVVTNESGAVVERDGYDAWGKRRFPNGADDPSGSLTSQTTRGFTGQEELADVGLVHLNGRVYDPLVGRMMSADPFVPDPLNAQALNRYSYVINNLLAFTDPNGYCFLGMCSWGKGISTFFNNAFRGLRLGPSIIGDLVELLAVAFCPVSAGLSCVVPAAFLSTTFVAGVTSGNLGYALKAGLIAGVTAGITAGVFSGISGITNPTMEAFPPDVYGYEPTPLPQITVTAPSNPAPSELPGVGGEVGPCYCNTVAPAVVNGVVGAFPGAHYSQQAVDNWRARNYGSAVTSGVLSLVDAATFWASVLVPVAPAINAVKGGVYALRNAEGVVMRTGRTGDLLRREADHARDPLLKTFEYDPIYRTDVYAEQRGLEQILHDTHNPSLNKINPIDPANPRLDEYVNAARDYLIGSENEKTTL